MYIKHIDAQLCVRRAVSSARKQPRGGGTMDLIVIAIVVGFFVVSAVLVGLLDRL
jgi:hypothetical protein